MARVLLQGIPFTIGPPAIARYSGPHDLRWMCGLPHAADWGYQVRYDLSRNSLQDILTALGDWRPDLLLFFQPEDQPPPAGTEHCTIKSAAVPADWSHTFPRIHGSIGKFDLAAFDRPGATRADWRGLCDPHYFGPIFTFDPTLHRNLGMARDIDVLYVGSMNHALRPERGILLPRLEALGNRLNIVITSGVYGEDYVRLLNRSKLVFNYSSRGELNLRVFETLACGAVPMIEQDNIEAAHDFVDGRDILLFTLSDMEERVLSTLASPESFDTFRSRCAARAEEYLPERLLDRFIERALETPASERKFNKLSEQERRYFNVMGHSGSSFPVVRSIEAQLLQQYVDRFALSDPRAWTLLARQLLTPVLHLFMNCEDDEVLKPSARKALEAAASLAPNDAIHQANAAWACRWCNDPVAARAYAALAKKAPRIDNPELLIGSLDSPAWARFMLATAMGKSKSELARLIMETLATE